MKQFIVVVLMLLNGSMLFAQDAKSYVHKGIELYNAKKYKDAEASYRKSVEKNQNVEGNFNLGDAYYKQKKFDDAAQQFTSIGSASNNAAVKAKAYHNLGNTLLEGKKFQESIDAYKKSLLNNPKDDQTRYNLSYAQQMLKKQQDQNKKNKDQNKDKKDPNKDKNKQDQDKKDQDKDKDKQNQDKNKDDKDKQDKQQQQPNTVSKDDAQRMLDALNNQEQGTQDKLKAKKIKGEKTHINKDW
jgi:Ca-activated chloride channel family protein